MAVVSSPGKADDGGKRKATGKSKESVKADDPPEHSHWLMKSEPESRFENGIDVKVCRDVPDSAPERSCGLTGLVHLSVRDWGSEDYVGPNQLLGRRSELSGQSNRNIPKSPTSLFYVTLTSNDLWPQARNFMRQMKKGQLAFFYHSNCKEPGIAGLMEASQASGPPMLRLAEILQPSAGCFLKSRSLRKRMWTTHSLIRKTSTLTPAVSLTTPNGAW